MFLRFLSFAVGFAIAASQEISPNWGQCGGIGFIGPTLCNSGWTCIVWDEWFSQCILSVNATTIASTTSDCFPTTDPTCLLRKSAPATSHPISITVTPAPSPTLSDPGALTCTVTTATLVEINLPIIETTTSCTAESLSTTACFPITTTYVAPSETTIVTFTTCETAIPTKVTTCCTPISATTTTVSPVPPSVVP